MYYLRRRGDLLGVAHGIQRLARFPAGRLEDTVVACLWAGEEAVASHESAFVVYGIGEAMPVTVHVTVPRPFRGRRRGVTVHHAELEADERAYRNGVPVTSPLRAIADVARHDPSGAGTALVDGLETGLVRRGHLEAAAARYPNLASVIEGV